MSEVITSNYPTSLDDTTSLLNDQVSLKSFVLNGDHSNSITTITTTSVITGFSAPNYFLIDGEIIHFTGISGVDFTGCTRGADGTSAASHSDADPIYHIATANWANQIRRAVIAIETELGTDPAGSLTDVKTRLAVSINDDGTLKSIPGMTLTGDLTFDGAYHPVIAPGSDTDAVLLEVTVTGTPQINWDESADNFAFSKGVRINPGVGGGNFKLYGDNEDGVRATFYTNDPEIYAAFYGWDENDGGASAYAETKVGAISDDDALVINPVAGTATFGSNLVVTLANTALHILDTNASHDLIIAPGSDLTADRTLTLTTGDAARTVTLSGNPTLADWFDQSVKQAASPTFASLTLTGDLAVNGGDITGTSALTVTPLAGQNLNVNLSTTGDFAVNTSQLYVDTSTGNVGIGTTSPEGLLHLQASGTANRLIIEGNSNDRWVSMFHGNDHPALVWETGDMRFGTATDHDSTFTGYSEKMRIKSDGNVGIGTTTPSGELHVKNTGEIYFSLGGSDARQVFNDGWSIGDRSEDGTFRICASTASLGTNPRLSITSTGNVGIGTTAPIFPLHIEGAVTSGVNLLLRDTAAQAAGVGGGINFGGKFTDAGAYTGFGRIGAYKETATTVEQEGYLTLSTNLAGTMTERMRITSAGNVGIGTAGPTNQMHIATTNDNAYALRVQGSTNNAAGVWTGIGIAGESANTKAGILFEDIGASYSRGKLHFALDNDADQTGADLTNVRMTITNDGNVGIGISTGLDGKTHIDQASTTAAIPVLTLDQADLSEQFFKFMTTIGVGNPIEAVGAKTLTTTHFIKVEIDGVGDRYLPVGTIA